MLQMVLLSRSEFRYLLTAQQQKNSEGHQAYPGLDYSHLNNICQIHLVPAKLSEVEVKEV